MDFVDYVEKVCDIKLFEYQKQFLRDYVKAQKEGKKLIINTARCSKRYYLYLINLYETTMDALAKEWYNKGGETEKCKTDISTG